MEKIFEQLPPDELINQLKLRKANLEQVLIYKENAKLKEAEGRLRIIHNKGNCQYYHVTTPKTNGKYINKENIQIAKNLAQKDYNKLIISAIEKQLKKISNILEEISKDTFAKVFESFSDDRQKLIEPVTLSNEEYAIRWQQEEYPKKTFQQDAPEFLVSTGLRVRSKSEVIIAETLIRMNIPFKYEYPLKLKSFNVHPDFYCLNVRTRQEFVWEHFGMLDDSDYLKTTLEKLDLYERSGYFQGVNLITTRETRDKPLNIKAIESKIKQFLL